MSLKRTHVTTAILFVALAGCYWSLSSGSIAGQGYTGEEIDSGLRMLSVASAVVKGHDIPPMLWSRHGPLPVLFDLPFLKLGKRVISPDYLLSFSPGLFTAGLVALLYLWLRKLCSPVMSLFLALTAAFGTMLWPYAYIGLETKQSFFVLLAGFLALAGGKIRTWLRLVLFAVACGLAISMKATGITLWPAIAYLIYVQFGSDWRKQQAKILSSALIVATIWALSHWGTNAYWLPRGGGGSGLKQWMIESPIHVFVNLIGLFGSPTKGLFLYAPVLLGCFYAIPRAFRTNRELTIYALLVTACTLGLLVLLTSPADEVWGCRYLHLAIAPLMVCIGAAWNRFRWRGEGAVLLLLALVGFVVSFLGTAYYYGVRDFAMTEAGQNTLQWITSDPVWNPVLFHARLFGTWLMHRGLAAAPWTPEHIWVWTPPPVAMAWKTINLRDYCQPQSFLIHFWNQPKGGPIGGIFTTYVICALVGALMMLWVLFRTLKDESAWESRRGEELSGSF